VRLAIQPATALHVVDAEQILCCCTHLCCEDSNSVAACGHCEQWLCVQSLQRFLVQLSLDKHTALNQLS
jgi:hypothetical protein